MPSLTTGTGVVPENRVRPEMYFLLTGLSVKAQERKIERGDWLEGREYHRAPDGTVWIDREGAQRWVVSRKRAG